MTENPYETRTSSVPGDGSAVRPDKREALPLGPGRTMWRALMRGARIAAVVGGAVSLLLILPALGLAAFGLGSGGGWALPRFFFYGIGSFLFFVGLGGIVGAGLGLIGALIGALIRSRTARLVRRLQKSRFDCPRTWRRPPRPSTPYDRTARECAGPGLRAQRL